LKLFFDPSDDDEEEEKEDEQKGEAAAAAAAFPRPKLGDTVVVPAGWSNNSTHGFLSRACILDPRTNQPRKGVEIRGPSVTVGSHMGEFTSPGVVTVRALSPERKEAGLPPVAMEFFVYEGTPGVKEGMIGNDQLEMLGVTRPMRHSTRG
jgi:hypothetical protein